MFRIVASLCLALLLGFAPRAALAATGSEPSEAECPRPSFPEVRVDERRVALVVGISAYAHAPALRNTRCDAAAMAHLLERAGFEVVRGFDLGKRDLEEKAQQFARAAVNADVSVFFYAGHGLQVNGVNYLVPSDAEMDDPTGFRFDLVDVDSIASVMSGPDRVGILLLDACRDNPFAEALRRMPGANREVALTRGLARFDSTPSGLLIGFATAPGEFAADGDGKHSPFTTALLEELAAPGLEIEAAMKRVKARVAALTSDAPVPQRPWTNSDMTVEFYLVPHGTAPVIDVATVIPPTAPQPNAPVAPDISDMIENPTTIVMPGLVPPIPAAPQDEFAARLLAPAGGWRDRFVGRPDAPVVMIEYFSPTAPHSADFRAKNHLAIKAAYLDSGRVRLVRRPFVRNVLDAAVVMLAASDAGPGYDVVIDTFLERQDEWAATEDRDALFAVAADLGFTQDEFDAALANRPLFDTLDALRQQALDDFGLTGIPTLYFNGRRVDGNVPMSEVKQAVETAVAELRLPPAAPPSVLGLDGFETAGGQSLLLEASDNGTTGAVPYSGTVSWALERDEDGLPALVGKASIPARNLGMDLLIRKNSDASLPASYLMEVDFVVPDTFIGGSIAGMPGILMKNEELAQGTALMGASARVSSNYFLFALTAAPQDARQNDALLTERRWMDIAMIYASGKRAILTLEKDEAAERLFRQVVAAWGE